MQMRIIVRFTAAVLVTVLATNAHAQSAQADYARLCSGCHGASFSIPSGAAARARTHEETAAVIRNGIAQRGMPSFSGQLSDRQILALVDWIEAQAANRSGLGRSIEAETLDAVRSSGYILRLAEQSPVRYVGYFGERSSLCYPDVDLTGVRSIELNYAKGSNDPGRFAVLIGDGIGKAQRNLGEKRTRSTGGWETFERNRIGLAQAINGRHELCFYGVEGGGILNLDSFSLSGEPGEHDGFSLKIEDVAPTAVSAAGYRFVLEKVAEAPSELWSMAFLPDGSMIIAQKSGQLLLFKDGNRIGHVEGVPTVWNGVQGGLLHVKPHPKYSENGWIYLTFSDPGANGTTAMTRVVRGKLDGRRWVEQQDIYRAPERFYTQDYAHFGSRIAFAGEYIYFSVGERQQPERAQSLAYPYGKIHRLYDDGRVPEDNPFVGRDDALPTIWSYGHRNPQGVARHPRTGAIWAAEHGPAGGDEINVVREGINYGWPLVSHGKHYDGRAVGESPYRDGIEPPIHHFTPSIGISQIEFYGGDKFPAWRDHLLVASLGRQELHLIEFRDTQVVSDRVLFKGFGRIRDVVVGPDGYPYVVLNQFAAGVYRLRPVELSST